MANATVTIDQFTKLLKRVEKLEYGHKEISHNVEDDINELKEDYHSIKKDVCSWQCKI